jgi:hypothetical protein
MSIDSLIITMFMTVIAPRSPLWQSRGGAADPDTPNPGHRKRFISDEPDNDA